MLKMLSWQILTLYRHLLLVFEALNFWIKLWNKIDPVQVISSNGVHSWIGRLCNRCFLIKSLWSGNGRDGWLDESLSHTSNNKSLTCHEGQSYLRHGSQSFNHDMTEDYDWGLNHWRFHLSLEKDTICICNFNMKRV